MEIATVLKSEAVLIANKSSMKAKRGEVNEMRSAIASVLNAKRKRYVMANIPKKALKDLTNVLQASPARR